MELSKQSNNRRTFLKTSGLFGASLLIPSTALMAQNSEIVDGNIHQFGKREGYTDQISILISMMDWMRATVLRSVVGLSKRELDFLLDEDSNSIGSMLLHLAATERFYQIHTLEGRPWGTWDKADKEKWSLASSLGKEARQKIKGNSLAYYTDALAEVRETTKEALKAKEDSWLMVTTDFFGNEPTNNYCKWFHVVEHESNHNGQIKYIKSRI
tara:strand:+ start:162230 stop:162868 length:639 start_codon:yes stop_codon:yes gene_type:complete